MGFALRLVPLWLVAALACSESRLDQVPKNERVAAVAAPAHARVWCPAKMLCEASELVKGWRTPVACQWRARRKRLAICEISGLQAEPVVDFFKSRYGKNMRWRAGRLDVIGAGVVLGTPARVIGTYDGQTWRLTFVQADPPNSSAHKGDQGSAAGPSDP